MNPAELLSYSFPFDKVDGRLLAGQSVNTEYVILLLFGAFSPITNMHLRALEMAKETIQQASTNRKVIAGYISPVSDFYQKNGLVNWKHRVQMCKLAVADSSWLMVDEWECGLKEWTKSVDLLRHLTQELSKKMNGHAFQVGIVMGSDLFNTFIDQSRWTVEELRELAEHNLMLVIERGPDCYAEAKEIVLSNDVLFANRSNILMVDQFVPFSISSTKVRLLVKRGYSVRYLVPSPVAQYIEANRLYN